MLGVSAGIGILVGSTKREGKKKKNKQTNKQTKLEDCKKLGEKECSSWYIGFMYLD